MTERLRFHFQHMAEKKKHSRELYSVLCTDLSRKEILKRRDICIHVTDSLCCTTETHYKATIFS